VDNYRQTHVQLLYNGQLDQQWRFDLAGHYTRGKGFFELYKAEELLSDFNVPIVDLGAVSDLIQRRWLDNHFYGITSALHYLSEDQRTKVTLGGALNNYRGRHFGEIIWTDLTKDLEEPTIYYDNDAEKFDFNIYGKINYQLTNALSGYVDLQFRYLKYQFEDGLRIPREDQLSFLNPKLGLVYRLTDQSRLYASFGVANREPNRSDFTESSIGSRPNPETLYNTELGYRQNWKKAMLGVNLYHMLYDDQLVLTGRINDVGEYTRRNVDDSYRLGVELEGMIMPVNALQIGGSLTLSQNKISSFTEFIDDWDNGGQIAVNHENTDLAFSPNIIFAGEISYDVLSKLSNQSLTVALVNKYVGSQFIDNTSNDNTRLDAYTFSDLRINYKVQAAPFKDLAITLLVRNIFNSKFSTNAWTYRYSSAGFDARPDNLNAQLEGGAIYNLTGLFPQAGTNFLLGVTLGF
ncbi:MAG: TonB-dependent receptor, partial [Bacteroidota bacterium]